MLRIREDNGDINYYSINNTTYTFTTTLTNDLWTHIALTDDGTTAKLYVNGSEITSPSTASFTSTTNTNLQIGRGMLNSGSVGNYTNGLIDQVRIFSKALNQSEVDSLYAETACVYTATTTDNDYPTTNTAYYKLDNSAEDEKGSYDGTETNIEYRFGRFGQAAVFNGSSSYISTNLYQGRIGSFSFWMKRDSTPSSNEILVAYNGSSSSLKGFFTQVQTDGDVRLAMNKGVSGTNGLSIFSSGVNTCDGNWHHIVAAWDITIQGSTNSYLYIDGNLNVSGTADDGNWTSGNSSNTYLFGNGTTSNSQVFEGSLDQVRIFSSALSSLSLIHISEPTRPY